MRDLSGYLVALCMVMFGTLASVTWLTGLGLEPIESPQQSAIAVLVENANPSK